MLRMHQKIDWTRSELAAFAELDGLEMEAWELADSCMGAVTVGSRMDHELTKIGEELEKLRKA